MGLLLVVMVRAGRCEIGAARRRTVQHLLLLLLLLPSWPGFQPTTLSSRPGRLGQEQDKEEGCYRGCGGTHFGAVRVYLMLRRLGNRHDSRTSREAEPALMVWLR